MTFGADDADRGMDRASAISEDEAKIISSAETTIAGVSQRRYFR